jgi:hypothetical protein
MLGQGSRIAAIALVLPTTVCALFAGLHVYNEVWRQWSEKWGWVNLWAGSVHSGFILVFAAIALVNFVILGAVGMWWLSNVRKPSFPHRGFAIWFAFLLVSAASYFPSDEQYAAVAVLLFGPGQKSQEFVSHAAERDSIVLLDALILRGAHIDDRALCVAAHSDSPDVVSRLIKRGIPTGVVCNRDKATALHNAVVAKQHRIVEILLDVGARSDVPDASGRTALDLAIMQHDDEMVRLLTQARQGATTDALRRQ